MPTEERGLRQGAVSEGAKDVGSGRKPSTPAKCSGAVEPLHAEAKGTATDGEQTGQCYSGGATGNDRCVPPRRDRADPWASDMILLESPLRESRTAGSGSGERRRD